MSIISFIGDFFPIKPIQEVLLSIILNPCATSWTKSRTNMAFTFIYICIVLVRKQDFHRIMKLQKIPTGREFVSSCSE